MTEIRRLQYGGPLWRAVAQYAMECSWKAGPALARKMREGGFSGWEGVFSAFCDGEIAGYCTLAKTDCIPDVEYTPYIGFVFVGEGHRGQRISQRMIRCALEYAKAIGFDKVYLVSGEKGLYEKYGFVKLEERKDIFGRDEQIFCIEI